MNDQLSDEGRRAPSQTFQLSFEERSRCNNRRVKVSSAFELRRPVGDTSPEPVNGRTSYNPVE